MQDKEAEKLCNQQCEIVQKTRLRPYTVAAFRFAEQARVQKKTGAKNASVFSLSVYSQAKRLQ